VFDLPRNVVFPADEVAIAVEPGPHPWEIGKADAIAANWRAETAANPYLFDGEVILLSRLVHEHRRISATCHPVRFSTFMHWRRCRPVAEAEHIFANAIPVSADNALVAIRMRAHTANAGKAYFSSGSFEPADFRDGQVDIQANMIREVREETGLDLTGRRGEAGFHAFSETSGTVIVRRFYLEETAEELAEKIRRFVAAQSDPEIEGPVIIRGAADLPDRLAPHMRPLIEWHFSGQDASSRA